MLQAQLAADVQTLASVNQLLTGTGTSTSTTKRLVPYILVAPTERDPIAVRALRVVREHYSGSLQALISDVVLLARLTAAGADAHHAALLSFVLFAPEFARALIELGEQDARRWIDQAHDLDKLWQVGPLETRARVPWGNPGPVRSRRRARLAASIRAGSVAGRHGRPRVNLARPIQL